MSKWGPKQRIELPACNLPDLEAWEAQQMAFHLDTQDLLQAIQS